LYPYSKKGQDIIAVSDEIQLPIGNGGKKMKLEYKELSRTK
jgi:hypothetical protein